LQSRQHNLKMLYTHYLVKNSFDVACRIINDTHTTLHQPALVKATHFLLKKAIINSVNWTLQTIDRGDMDTYFVIYRWNKTFII